MSNKPILFYSPNCTYCKSLWGNLDNKNILNNIHKINVHKNEIPSNVTSVPTLFIQGRGNLTGDAINLFFNSYIPPEKNIKTNIENSSNQQFKENKDDIKDFLPGEMGNNWSDNYSYIEDAGPINHSYSFLTENSDIPITNNIEIKNQEKSKTGRNDDISRRMEELKSSRDREIQQNIRM